MFCTGMVLRYTPDFLNTIFKLDTGFLENVVDTVKIRHFVLKNTLP